MTNALEDVTKIQKNAGKWGGELVRLNEEVVRVGRKNEKLGRRLVERDDEMIGKYEEFKKAREDMGTRIRELEVENEKNEKKNKELKKRRVEMKRRIVELEDEMRKRDRLWIEERKEMESRFRNLEMKNMESDKIRDVEDKKESGERENWMRELGVLFREEIKSRRLERDLMKELIKEL